jgi:hypothetical protein
VLVCREDGEMGKVKQVMKMIGTYAKKPGFLA